MFYFTPLPGFFSPFPRGTGSLSVTQEYLALRGGPRRFTRNSTCSCYSGSSGAVSSFRLQDFHLLWCRIQLLRLTATVTLCCPTTPTVKTIGLGCSLFAHHYWGNRCLISVPQATKMFQFTWLARADLWIQSAVQGVAPFGHLRINACFQLPEAFRR
jgi:hypothetical protein